MYNDGVCQERINQFIAQYAPQHGTIFATGGSVIGTLDENKQKMVIIEKGIVNPDWLRSV